jgi:hypothetical protein
VWPLTWWCRCCADTKTERIRTELVLRRRQEAVEKRVAEEAKRQALLAAPKPKRADQVRCLKCVVLFSRCPNQRIPDQNNGKADPAQNSDTESETACTCSSATIGQSRSINSDSHIFSRHGRNVWSSALLAPAASSSKFDFTRLVYYYYFSRLYS